MRMLEMSRRLRRHGPRLPHYRLGPHHRAATGGVRTLAGPESRPWCSGTVFGRAPPLRVDHHHGLHALCGSTPITTFITAPLPPAVAYETRRAALLRACQSPLESLPAGGARRELAVREPHSLRMGGRFTSHPPGTWPKAGLPQASSGGSRQVGEPGAAERAARRGVHLGWRLH
jgi:hypothetical protein